MDYIPWFFICGSHRRYHKFRQHHSVISFIFLTSVGQVLLDLAFKMAAVYRMVTVSCAGKSGDVRSKFDFPVNLVVEHDPQGISVKLKRGKHLLLLYCKIFNEVVFPVLSVESDV